jgi:hypothetical protein
MHIRLTPAEAIALGRIGGLDMPPVITSVAGDGDVVRVTADLRKLDQLPSGLKMAARLAPVARADVRVIGFADGVATLAVEAHAAGLPAHRLLGLLAGPIEKQLEAQGLPKGTVDVRPDATLAVHVDTLLEEKAPGLDVTDVRLADGHVHVDASVS